MIRPELLDMPALHCSLDRELGDFYQDFSPANRMVESGYHGTLDERGVPLVRYTGQGSFRNVITTAQYALANMTAARRGETGRMERVRALCDSMVETQVAEGEWKGCWIAAFDDPKYPWLRAPWCSALGSGNALSALLRGWEMLGDPVYLEAAEAAYHGLHRPRDRMALVLEDGAELWYEEYPATPPLHVLNGHVYALLGVADYARVTGDPEADRRWRKAADTVARNLGAFDLGYWSGYDMRTREPVSVHYHKNIHIPQLRILGRLTGRPEFDRVADRWQGYLHSPVSAVRRRAAGWRRGMRKRLARLSAAARGDRG